LRKLCGIVLFAFFAFHLAMAQDAMKVEPSHYKLAFDNEKVQVVYIHYGPHEKSKLHSHAQGVVVNITKAHLLFTSEDGKTQEVYSKPGEARWFPPLRHTVQNLGNTPYDGVFIGVKGGASATGTALPQLDPQTAGILAAFAVRADSNQQPR
jgi:hypothetical protein